MVRRIFLSLLLAALLLALLAWWGGVGPVELVDSLRALPPRTFLLALALHTAIYLLRALRFRILLPAASRPSFGHVLAVSSAHNLAAYVLPAKTGEASFVVYLKALCGVRGAESLASLLLSRLLDLATLAGGVGAAALALALLEGGASRAWALPVGGALLAAALALGLLCLRSELVPAGARALARILRLDRAGLGARLAAATEQVAAALREAGRGGRLFAGALVSLPLWLGVFLFYAVLARGLGIDVDLAHATFGSGLAIAANLLPVNGLAGFGTQEAGWVVGFGLLGVPRDLALASGLGAHLVQLANVILFGLLAHLALGLLPRAGSGASGGLHSPVDDSERPRDASGRRA